MKSRVTKTVLWTAVIICVLCSSGLGQNVATTSYVKQLEERISVLEKRLESLEKQVKPEGVTREEIADEIEQRLASLEKKYGASHGSDSLEVYWKDGLRLETEDKSFRFKIGGRMHHDWAWFADEDVKGLVGELEDGTEFRRAWLDLSGQIYENIEFRTEYDFAGGDADFKDVWVALKDLPYIGYLKLGHFREPFGLERLTSSNYITFMERALPTAFAPGRNTGAMIYDDALGRCMTWALGVFRDTDSFGDGSSDGDYSYTGRITFLPWYKDGGRKLLHLGAAYSHRSPNDRQLRYRQRPESHLAPRFVDTGSFEAKRADLIGLEAALVYGPFSLQGEYIQSVVDAINATDACFQGFYAQASYFLTGEHRPYRKSSGTFGRVKPKKNFNWKGGKGPGAWEVAARYSYLDLDEKRFTGGRLQDFAFGVNWYLNPNIRIMWNYIFADLADRGDADIFQTRIQIDF